MNRPLPIGQLPSLAAWREAGGTPELYVACSNLCLDYRDGDSPLGDALLVVESLLGQLGWDWQD